MYLREDILAPIEGESPGGISLRYDPVYEEIKELRREEEDLEQGAWKHERKTADYGKVIRMTSELIATKSKDLQLAAWLTEALLNEHGYGGLLEGLQLCNGLLTNFWESLFPELDETDLEIRAAPLNWIGLKLELPLRKVPMTRDGHGFYLYKESRTVGYEAQAKTDAEKKNRQKMIKEHKLEPEVFDKSFEETPKAFYVKLEKDLDGSLEQLKALGKFCDEKFGDDTPSFGTMEKMLGEIRHTAHMLLEKKRLTEPDPVEEKPAEAAAGGEVGAEGGAVGEGGGTVAAAPGLRSLVIPLMSSEPPDVRDAIANVAAAAALLRQKDPYNPGPYLMLRGLRWGELRAAAELSDPTLLEAPPTEIRQNIKRLAVDGKWKDLLEAAELVMAMPCSRAWLDMQRFVVEACVALGDKYYPIAKAIRSELKTLVRDVPKVLTATMMDDTAAANPETMAWLKELLSEASEPPPAEADGKPKGIIERNHRDLAWKKRFTDSYELAMDALRGGNAEQAFEILHHDIQMQSSNRGKFIRKLQLVEVCTNGGKDEIAQPILDDLAAAVDNHKLEEWEDPEWVASALATIARLNKRISGDAKEKKKYFDRICRLDPVRALTI